MSNHPSHDHDDDDDDDEPLTLGADALAALQSVLGGTGNADDADASSSLAALLAARRMAHDDDDDVYDDDDDGDDHRPESEEILEPGESHADYYRRLYPERYDSTGTASSNGTTSEATTRADIVEHPIAIVSMEDDYVQNLILKSFLKKPHWTVRTTLPCLYHPLEEGNDDTILQQQDDNNDDDIYHFHWGEYEHLDWFSKRFQSCEILVSCYYNRKGLIRKGLLAKTLEKWHTKYPHKPRLAPKSYILTVPITTTISSTNKEEQEQNKEEPLESMEKFVKVFDHALKESQFPGFGTTTTSSYRCTIPKTWIVKPSVTNQAKGICLVQSREQLLEAIYTADSVQRAGDFVLQDYIDQPLLLDQRKFHLRVFVVLVGNVSPYVFEHFLAIFSLEPYPQRQPQPNNDTDNDNDTLLPLDIQNTRAHLTNIAHQQVLGEEDQHRCMRLFDETKQDMVDAGHVHDLEQASKKISDIQTRVYQMVAETIEAVSLELTFSSNQKNGFELFGFDFMVDKDWNTWLLEANAEPDLSKAGDRLQPVIDQLLLETLDLVLGQDARFPQDEMPQQSSLIKVYEKTRKAF